MLFIVFGATLDIGYETRRIFRGLGFDVITKYNYVSDDAPVDKSKYADTPKDSEYAKWYDDKVYIDEQELSMLDFSYGLDGVKVGFNQEQIMDAVRGVKNAVLTAGGSALDFIIQLKQAYGDYVTVINIFEDKPTVIASTAAVSDKEKETRISANERMQRLYISSIEVFDATVIYTGEGTAYDLAALEMQYSSIMRIRKKLENALNNKKYVELPYSGIQPYIFVSYSHEDWKRVQPILAALQRNSFRVWYDDGIHSGTNWRKVIEEKITNAHTVLLMHSKSSAASRFVNSEIYWALECNKNIHIIKLDDSRYSSGLNMDLNPLQFISADDTALESRLTQELPGETRSE